MTLEFLPPPSPEGGAQGSTDRPSGAVDAASAAAAAAATALAAAAGKLRAQKAAKECARAASTGQEQLLHCPYSRCCSEGPSPVAGIQGRGTRSNCWDDNREGRA